MFFIVLLGLSLSMDAFTVSFVNGLGLKRFLLKYILLVAICFGLFQGIMPLIGYFISELFLQAIDGWQEWLVFVILTVIGAKMLYEAFGSISKNKIDNNLIDIPTNQKDMYPLSTTIVQGVVTSIDALAAGLSIAVIGVNIYISVSVIALITFVVCLFGICIGYKSGKLFKDKQAYAEILGGIVLIGLGLSFIIRHYI